jgi:hypothetical protein
MIKARAGDVVILGLSARNIELLKSGKPIDIDMQTLGLKGHTVIFYGDTEQQMQRELAEFIGPDTHYTTSEKDD